ncbi:TMEM14 family protein [Fontisphaera persica]|uniref:TMEM14 family protein n=1 Tax=Fontisphaera persica TaxID=2974023 RepID=UPI0024C0B763|nr:TMEM14 family protein [Fontisphaera persica]WCJ60510.1 TMEM14 family protein [Fontisphaera persica]
MTKIVLWVYVVLLVVGGLIGYLKAGSTMSLVTSTIFAIPLALCALGVLPPWVGRLLTAVLAGFFVFRVIKTGKFMPAGMMAIVSAIVLLLLFLL